MPVEYVPMTTQDLEVRAKPAKDCLIPRGSKFDTYVRTLGPEGDIIYHYDRVFPDPRLSLSHIAGDILVERVMDGPPLLVHLLRGSVIVSVYYYDFEGKLHHCRGNGALLSDRLVLTAGHLFNIKAGGRLFRVEVHNGASLMIEALVKQLPEELLGSVPDEDQGAEDDIHLRKIDIAVLELVSPAPLAFGVPFKLPKDGWMIPGHEPVAMLGLPGDVLASTSEPLRYLVPYSVRREMKSKFALQSQDLDELAEKLYKVSIKTENTRVVCFGSTWAGATMSNPESYIYSKATYSTVNGLSGSPVVSASNPDTLLGINCGGLSDSPISIYLNTYSSFALKLWEWLGLSI